MCGVSMLFMRSLEAYERDIFIQPKFLSKFQPQKSLSRKVQQNIIFTGSGDSLVSAMLAEVFSNYQVKSFDPLDLLKNKYILKIIKFISFQFLEIQFQILK